MKKSGILITFVLSILTIPLYIYTHTNGLEVFWLIFILDRILSPIVQYKFENHLDLVGVGKESDENTFVITTFVLALILLCIIGIGMLVYVLFNYPKLFIIIMIGEVIDKVIEKIILKTRKNHN